MDAPLSIEKARRIGVRNDGAVPDVGMQVESAAAVTPEGPELLRANVVPWQRQRYDEALPVEWIEELPAVGMIVRTPDERAFACRGGTCRARFLRPLAPAEEIAVAHGVVACVECFAFPPELEQSLGDTTLITAPCIDRAPSLLWPTDDLYLETLRVIHQAAVALETLRARDDEGRVMDVARPCRGHVGKCVGI